LRDGLETRDAREESFPPGRCITEFSKTAGHPAQFHTFNPDRSGRAVASILSNVNIDPYVFNFEKVRIS